MPFLFSLISLLFHRQLRPWRFCPNRRGGGSSSTSARRPPPSGWRGPRWQPNETCSSVLRPAAAKPSPPFCRSLASWRPGPSFQACACLYLAPLKALGNDVRKNLRAHLRGFRQFLPPGCGQVRVGLRTGDTSAVLRQRQRHDPPEILLTTPESLAVLLSQTWAAEMFAGLRWVIVDEVHALAASKRGCDLSLSLERLGVLVGGGLQRIGLSATCTPPVEAASFLVGVERDCALAQVGETRPLDLTIEFLEPGPHFLTSLVTRLGSVLRANQSTLIFTNTRSLAERLAWRLRQRYPAWVEEIGVHHSALAAPAPAGGTGSETGRSPRGGQQ